MIIPENILKLMSPADRAKYGKAGLTAAEALEKAVITSERKLQAALIQYLHLHGIEDVLQPDPNKKSGINKGWPDLTFGLMWENEWDGSEPFIQYEYRHCAWEAKMPGKKPEPHQEECHARLRKQGWQVAIITSIEDARAELVRLGVI